MGFRLFFVLRALIAAGANPAAALGPFLENRLAGAGALSAIKRRAAFAKTQTLKSSGG